MEYEIIDKAHSKEVTRLAVHLIKYGSNSEGMGDET